MKSYQVINKLNQLKVNYTVSSISETEIDFVVMQFVCASTVKVNLLDMSIEEIHGLGSYRIHTYCSSEESLVETLSYKVKHFSRLGAIHYEPQT